MYRKLVVCAVSILGLMTLVVSAQQPGDIDRGAFPAPLQVPGWAGQSGNTLNPYYGSRAQKEEFELAHKSEQLVKQLAKAEGENKEKIKTQLTDTLGKQFDARQKRHEAEIKALEAQVKKLKDLVQKRQENRRDIISKRLEQLTREADGLGW